MPRQINVKANLGIKWCSYHLSTSSVVIMQMWFDMEQHMKDAYEPWFIWKMHMTQHMYMNLGSSLEYKLHRILNRASFINLFPPFHCKLHIHIITHDVNKGSKNTDPDKKNNQKASHWKRSYPFTNHHTSNHVLDPYFRLIAPSLLCGDHCTVVIHSYCLLLFPWQGLLAWSIVLNFIVNK